MSFPTPILRLLALCLASLLIYACEKSLNTTDSSADPSELNSSSNANSNDNPATRPSRAGDYHNLNEQLQGAWERTTYPYDQITFRDGQMKYEQGEGAAEPAQFEPYTLAANCRDGARGPYIVRNDGALCNEFTVSANQLNFVFDGGKDEIIFKRMDESGSLSLPPLREGFYVLEGSDCSNSANAGWRFWTGYGLRGSATTDCQAEVRSKAGDTYGLSQDCRDTYTKQLSQTDLRLRVVSTDVFVLDQSGKQQRFVKCDEVPDWYSE